MDKRITIPQKVKRTKNFTVRFSTSERAKLDLFCKSRNTTLAELIRFSLKTVMERAK